MSEFDDALGGVDEGPAGLTPAAPDSPLAGLRASRDKARQKLTTDLRVPRLEPEVYVRYKPIPLGRINAVNTALGKSKATDKEVSANAAILADVCVGVFTVDEDGEPVGDPSEWPRFDQDLAEILGVPKLNRGSAIVRELYLTDGDIVATVRKLSEWSGFAHDQLEREAEGN